MRTDQGLLPGDDGLGALFCDCREQPEPDGQQQRGQGVHPHEERLDDRDRHVPAARHASPVSLLESIDDAKSCVSASKGVAGGSLFTACANPSARSCSRKADEPAQPDAMSVMSALGFDWIAVNIKVHREGPWAAAG